MGDELADLPAIMGKDFGYGYDDSLGDPNIKPRIPPAPKEIEEKRTAETAFFIFPAQQQFIDKLIIQLVAINDSSDLSNPFSGFSTSVEQNRSFSCTTNPRTTTQMTVKGLMPGTKYVARLVITNPSGTAAGKPADMFMTLPRAPPAPTVVPKLVDGDCQLEVSFPEHGQHLTRLVVQCIEDSEPDSSFDDHEKVIEAVVMNPETSTSRAVERMRPGTRYKVRLFAKNSAGQVSGVVSSSSLTYPRAHQLIENISERTSTTIGFVFDNHDQELTRLSILFIPNKSKDPNKDFVDAICHDIPDPQSARRCKVCNLKPDVTYSFRLRAENHSGFQDGPISQIKTIEYVPSLQDKSGWLYEMPRMDGKRTLGRRLSFRKNKPKRFFFVLDGKLLTWYDEPKGTELGFAHLGKALTLEPEDIASFSIHFNDGTVKQLLAESTNPNVSSEDLCTSWKIAIKSAIDGKPLPAAASNPISKQSQQENKRSDEGVHETPVLGASNEFAEMTLQALPSSANQIKNDEADDEQLKGFEEDEEFGF